MSMDDRTFGRLRLDRKTGESVRITVPHPEGDVVVDVLVKMCNRGRVSLVLAGPRMAHFDRVDADPNASMEDVA
jgi:hypothetical protein